MDVIYEGRKKKKKKKSMKHDELINYKPQKQSIDPPPAKSSPPN